MTLTFDYGKEVITNASTDDWTCYLMSSPVQFVVGAYISIRMILFLMLSCDNCECALASVSLFESHMFLSDTCTTSRSFLIEAVLVFKLCIGTCMHVSIYLFPVVVCMIYLSVLIVVSRVIVP